MQPSTSRIQLQQPAYSEVAKHPSDIPSVFSVKSGDTLSEMVRDFLRDSGQNPTLRDIYQGVRTVAHTNGIADPDRIRVGQTIDLSALAPASAEAGATMQAQVSPSSVREPASSPPEFSLPVQGRITSRFGLREHPIDHVLRFHKGVDIAAAEGTPILAANDGRVAFAGWKNGYGQVVEIDHGQGYRTLYAHTSENLVSIGEVVKKGQEIAEVGATGRVTGPHVHFEVSRRGKEIDPLSPETPQNLWHSPMLLAKAE